MGNNKLLTLGAAALGALGFKKYSDKSKQQSDHKNGNPIGSKC